DPDHNWSRRANISDRINHIWGCKMNEYLLKRTYFKKIFESFGIPNGDVNAVILVRVALACGWMQIKHLGTHLVLLVTLDSAVDEAVAIESPLAGIGVRNYEVISFWSFFKHPSPILR